MREGGQPPGLWRSGLVLCIQEEVVEGSCFSPRRDFWGLSSCKLKAALNLEELPGGAHDEFHVSFWVSAMVGGQRGGRRTWPSGFTCIEHKRLTGRVSILELQGHTGLPGVRQPDHAQDGVGARDSLKSGSMQSWPPSNVISSSRQIPSPPETHGETHTGQTEVLTLLLQTHLQLLHRGPEVTRGAFQVPWRQHWLNTVIFAKPMLSVTLNPPILVEKYNAEALQKPHQLYSFYLVNYIDKPFRFSLLLFPSLTNGQWKFWLCWEKYTCLWRRKIH